MKFEQFKQEIIAHAEDVFPHECLGVIVDGKYERLENVSHDPENLFEMSEADEDRFGFGIPGVGAKPEAVVHSHPTGELWPSEGDMKAQIAHQVPFVMIGHTPATGWDYWELGDHTLDDPLEGREFRHGPADCYAAIRSWHWQNNGLLMPDFARRDRWWEPVHLTPGDPTSPIIRQPDNLYSDNFEKAGFVQLTAEELDGVNGLQVGDVFFYKLHVGTMASAAKTIETHGGVYVGNGEIYHHLPGRRSVIEAAEGWARKASRWVRYKGEAA